MNLSAGHYVDLLDRPIEGHAHLPSWAPFRPVQYLGNKLRALPEILDAAGSLIGRQGRVADLFTGTTVVAQGFAGRGYKVSAADTQRYAVIFARAMLGIGRQPGESCSYAALSGLGLTAPDENYRQAWKPFLDREEEAIVRADAAALTALTSDLPLIWRLASHPLRQKVEVASYRR